MPVYRGPRPVRFKTKSGKEVRFRGSAQSVPPGVLKGRRKRRKGGIVR